MATRDVFHRVLVKQLTDPAVATGTVTSSSVDTAGFEAVALYASFGESADTLSGSVYWDCKLQDSPDDSAWTDVTAANVIGAAANQFGLVNAAADDDAIYGLGYGGTERYVRLVVTKTGTHTNGTPIGAYAILHRAAKLETSQTVTP